jgi:hypothetical protein
MDLLLTMPDNRHRRELRAAFKAKCTHNQWLLYKSFAAKPGTIEAAAANTVTRVLCAMPRGDHFPLFRDTFLSNCTPAQAVQARQALRAANRI